MTAKQSLANWVGSLSEAEAAAWLERVQSEAQAPGAAAAKANRLRALFARWDEEGPAMTEDEWAAFATSLDEERHSDRKLFS